MRIAGVQLSVGMDTPKQNVEKAVAWIHLARQAGAEIICLQEYFATGAFTWQLNRNFFSLSETEAGSTILTMSQLAKEVGVALIIPLFEKDSEIPSRYYNSAFVIDDVGRVLGCYRKQHIALNTRALEKYYFMPGNVGSPVFHAKDLNFGINLCFDRHFPEIARCFILRGAQVLFVPTATSRARRGRADIWVSELVALAVNYGTYVVGVNSTGFRDNKDQFGCSVIIDPFGEILSSLSEEEGFVIADFNEEKVLAARSKTCDTHYRRDILELLLELYRR